MSKLETGLVFALWLQVAIPLGVLQIPPKCKKFEPKSAKPLECCNLPKIFQKSDFEACGFYRNTSSYPAIDFDILPTVIKACQAFLVKTHYTGYNFTATFYLCAHNICMLKRLSLIKEDGTIMYEAVADFLYRMGMEHPRYKEAFMTTRKRCIRGKMRGPPESCEHHNIIVCITGTLFNNCPTWSDKEPCRARKAMFSECQEYYGYHNYY